MGVLPVGHHVRLETLLYGLLLPSGNDAAVALSEHVSHRVSTFVHLMNTEAAGLGMGCTRYSSPSGYYDHGNYSCAADLAMLAREDLLQPRIARVTRTLSAALPVPDQGREAVPLQQQPAADLPLPRHDGPEDGLHRSRRSLPGRHGRTRRRAPRGRGPALHRTRPPGPGAAQPGLRGRLPPSAGARNGIPPGRLSPSSARLTVLLPGRLSVQARPGLATNAASVEYRCPRPD